jgi:hypothetical protein
MLNNSHKLPIFDVAKVININRIKKEDFMKTLNYLLIPVAFLLSACASGQYSSSEDGIYFNPDKSYVSPTPAVAPAMAKAQQLNEKTQAAVTTRTERAASKKQVDTLYVTDENRTVDIDAEPDKTYLIVDESDSYARRLHMFDDDEEYTPPTVNVNVNTGYGYPYYYGHPYYSSRYRPWYWSSWAWDPWDSWYYPGYYRPWYYGGYYGHYGHYGYYPHYHHHHNDYYYPNSHVQYGRRLAGTGTVRRAATTGSSNNTGTVRRAQPQIHQVNSSRQSSNVAASRRSVSPTSSNNNATVTRRSSNTGTSTNYTRSSTTKRTTTSTNNGSSSRRSTTSYSSSSSSSRRQPSTSSRSTSSSSSAKSSSSSGSSRSSSSSGSSRRR